MADAPNLNSATDATAAKYAPLSWLGVLSLAVAVVFVGVLLALGWLAYKAGQPLLVGWLFLLPATSAFLAFLSRREIRNSEGARTGVVYANAGWWVSVVVGACYLAYLLANDLAVRSEGERVATQWAEKLFQGKPGDAADPNVWAAYEKTLDPGSAQVGNPQAAHAPQSGMPFGLFRNTPLLLVWDRNRDTAKFTPNGLRNWELTPDGKLNCEVAASVSCAEGEFPVLIPLQATTDPTGKVKGRTWQVMSVSKYQFLNIEQASRTKYGWLVAALERGAMMAADQFLEIHRAPAPFGPSAAIDGYISGHRSHEYTDALVRGLDARIYLVGPTALILGPTDPTELPAADRPANFFTRSNGEAMTDAAYTRQDGAKTIDGLKSLREVWERPALAKLAPAPSPRAGFRPTEAAPRYSLIDTSDPNRIVIKVPVDFQPRRDEFLRNSRWFTTGHLVMACDDPVVMKELSAAFADAKAGNDKPKKDPPDGLLERRFPFRVIRFESDLLPIAAVEAQQGPSAPIPQGGGGPPGR